MATLYTSEQALAEALAATRIREPGFVREDARGRFIEVLNEGTWSSIITGSMRAGAVLGNHYHKETELYLYLISGQAIVRTVHVTSRERDEFVLPAGAGAYLPVMESHVIRFTRPGSFILLKSRPYDPKAPDTYPFPVEGS